MSPQLTQLGPRSLADFSLLVWVGKLESEENAEAVLPFFPKLGGLGSLSSLMLWIVRFI